MVAIEVTATVLVLTVKVADAVPSGMVTLVAGSVAKPASLLRATRTPPAGAGALRVTTPVED